MTEISAMHEALDNMDDYALMANVKPVGPHKVLTDAIAELETLRHRVAELKKQRDELLAALEGILSKIPGGRGTDKWESSRVADFNEGWNAYRKTAREVIYAAITSVKENSDGH